MIKLLLGVWLALAPQNPATLQGTVKRAGTSEPIGGVELTLSSGLRVTSDAQGRFVFENLPPGKYNVRASRNGYFNHPDGLPLPMQVVSALTLDASQRESIVIELVPGAAVGGRITDAQGNPLTNVSVSAMKIQYNEGRAAFSAGSQPQKTDDRGQYRLYWFGPGEYYIRAEYADPRGAIARRAYYPGTTDSGQARPFLVRGGESFDAMDFSLPVANNIKISGKVTLDGSPPVGGVIRTFFLLPRDGRPTEQYPQEFSNTIQAQPGMATTDFVIEARGIAPGSYDLAPFFLDSANAFHTGRTRIDIGDRDLENVTAFISPDIELSGRLTFRGEAGPPNWGPFSLQLRSREATAPLTSRSNTAVIRPDGTFSISNVIVGRYQLYIGALPGTLSSTLYVSGLRQGALDIRDEGTIDVRRYTDPLEITVSSGAGKVHGVVEGPTGAPYPRAHVALVPQLSRRRNVMFYDRVIADAKGEFNFEGIAPGEYKVFAFEQLPDTAEQNPEFIARYETLGQSLTISSGATMESRVRLVR
jgi:hypothetical protein